MQCEVCGAGYRVRDYCDDLSDPEQDVGVVFSAEPGDPAGPRLPTGPGALICSACYHRVMREAAVGIQRETVLRRALEDQADGNRGDSGRRTELLARLASLDAQIAEKEAGWVGPGQEAPEAGAEVADAAQAVPPSPPPPPALPATAAPVLPPCTRLPLVMLNSRCCTVNGHYLSRPDSSGVGLAEINAALCDLFLFTSLVYSQVVRQHAERLVPLRRRRSCDLLPILPAPLAVIQGPPADGKRRSRRQMTVCRVCAREVTFLQALGARDTFVPGLTILVAKLCEIAILQDIRLRSPVEVPDWALNYEFGDGLAGTGEGAKHAADTTTSGNDDASSGEPSRDTAPPVPAPQINRRVLKSGSIRFPDHKITIFDPCGGDEVSTRQLQPARVGRSPVVSPTQDLAEWPAVSGALVELAEDVLLADTSCRVQPQPAAPAHG